VIRSCWRALLLVAFLVVVATAQARGPVFGVTLDPLAPNGSAFGVQLDWPVLDFEVGTTPLALALRFDAHAPLRLDLYPSVNAGVSMRFPGALLASYVGTGVGLWWSRIEGQPCWDVSWTVHGGVDVPLAEALAVRVEAQAAPLIGAFRVGVGVAFGLNLSEVRIAAP
jgi:hypothetical protein